MRTFQCSSASRKFLNLCVEKYDRRVSGFQCSSASRKFLNHSWLDIPLSPFACFSALQRAENSSILKCVYHAIDRNIVSVLFSEPKIPQSHLKQQLKRTKLCFSALQRAENSSIHAPVHMEIMNLGFSALQRAENSSIGYFFVGNLSKRHVSVLFSEPKIPQSNKYC